MLKFVIFTVILAEWRVEAQPVDRNISNKRDAANDKSLGGNMEASIYVIPKRIMSSDTIVLDCDLNQHLSRVIVGLTGVDSGGSPDLSNVIWQKTLDFEKNTMTLATTKNGRHKSTKSSNPVAAYSINDSLNLTIFINEDSISGMIGNSDFEDIQLKHSLTDIRFLRISGDVKKVKRLEFNYGPF